MHAFFERQRNFWTDKTILRHLFFSFFFIFFALLLTYYSRIYVNNQLGTIAPDLFLDNLPVYNVSIVFFQGAFSFVVVLIGILLWTPAYIPFVLETTALFYFVRSFFMVMTHLSAPSVEYYQYIEREHHISQTLFTLSSGNDQFFSAHTGFPFLLALIFWQCKSLRYFFLICSVIGGFAVILGHLHYSIDVFSSFFIAFGVYEISKWFFKKEYSLLKI